MWEREHQTGKIVHDHSHLPEGPDVRWIAEASDYAGPPYVLYRRLKVIRETPCGVWLECGSFEVWRKHDSNRAAATKREALYHLLRRKQSHMKHARRRFEAAQLKLSNVEKVVEEDVEEAQSDPELWEELR